MVRHVDAPPAEWVMQYAMVVHDRLQEGEVQQEHDEAERLRTTARVARQLEAARHRVHEHMELDEQRHVGRVRVPGRCGRTYEVVGGRTRKCKRLPGRAGVRKGGKRAG